MFCAFEKEKMINNDEGVPLLLFSVKSRPAFVWWKLIKGEFIDNIFVNLVSILL